MSGGAADVTYLRDVLVIPESVHAGDFKVDLASGFDDVERRLDEYVVTDQLARAFATALDMVKGAIEKNESEAAYLRGSFGSGKSHFLTVLHAILDGHPAARRKERLRELIGDHERRWMRGRRFLMVPFHLIGATDLGSAILGGYAREVRRLGLSAPPVYRSDAMLADARTMRERLGDDQFTALLGDVHEAEDEDGLPVIGGAGGGWTPEALDRAFAAPYGDEERTRLETALLDGPFSNYVTGAQGEAAAFLPLEDGLAAMSRHAQRHGYDGLILFLDELVLWLQAYLSDQSKVRSEIDKLVKLVESGTGRRPVPIVSFISQQRDLTTLVGEDVMGADVKELEKRVNYLAGRLKVISLEDRNLPAIVKERVLRPRPGKAAVLDEAFAAIESSNATVKDVLLDATGATHATWQEFRDVYPLSPALLNALVALSGALQRERSGLKLISELLSRRRGDMKVGELIPIGDLWDVLMEGVGEPFSDVLRSEVEHARRFHAKVRAHLLERYGRQDERFRADDRLVKTLILGALAPDVPALTRLTGPRLAALNHGTIRSRAVAPGSVVVSRLQELIAAGFGEIRADGDHDPVFTLHLSDLDVEPLLERVGEVDNAGARRRWIKLRLWEQLKVTESGAIHDERLVIWKGTRRTAEFVFGNVRDQSEMYPDAFKPSVEGRIRFVFDYPFDIPDHYPSDDAQRIDELRRDGLTADTLVWLPYHLSVTKSKQLGRLLKIQYLLERDRLDDYAGDFASDQRMRIRTQLKAQADNLTSQLTTVLQQLYGIAHGDEANRVGEIPDGRHVLSLRPGFEPRRLHAAAGFEYNMLDLAGELLDDIYPKHPDLDLQKTGKAVTTAELRNALKCLTEAQVEGGGRTVVDRKQLAPLKRIIHPLELGEVHDGPVTVSPEWRRRIEQLAARHGRTGDYQAEEIRRWIEEYGWTGLDRPVANLIIAVYGLLSDRVWAFNGAPEPAPDLERIGPGWALRDQPKPSPAEFAAARVRAERIFGIKVPDTLTTRTVAELARRVREKTGELSDAVTGVERALKERAHILAVTDENADRRRSARYAADLLDRLTRVGEQGDTPLLREFAAVSYDVDDEVIGAAVASAPAQFEALDRATPWRLLEAAPDLARRDDDIGEQARALLGALAQAASAHERTTALAPVLHSAGETASALVAEAARSEAPPRPVSPSVPEPARDTETGRGTETGSDSEPVPTLVRDGDDPDRDRPVTPSGRGRRRVAASRIATALHDEVAALEREIRAFADANPGAAIEIEWRVTDEGPDR
ncbi:PglY protein [Actinomadura sp. SCN-SB]|uniref:PglY protein n=1 Tax=Actinomadura sp. SCN-SB TaxID=3373092 RepID=UPI003753D779